MTATDQADPAAVLPLPGLERPARPVGFMESEAQAHIDALRAAGRIGDSHRLLVALVLSQARSADIGMGKIAGSHAAKLLAEAMEKLPPLEDDAEDDAWAAVVAALAPERGDDPT